MSNEYTEEELEECIESLDEEEEEIEIEIHGPKHKEVILKPRISRYQLASSPQSFKRKEPDEGYETVLRKVPHAYPKSNRGNIKLSHEKNNLCYKAAMLHHHLEPNFIHELCMLRAQQPVILPWTA
ncbi:Hypothetical predicted protein [Xyrichtys novacula]|uniref:Uncharacterized protein n=1 Tax=Xyrichtys novacula TaxID=13765 RepID=A0AAV1ER48_XYRNO|nr:Hypothetical predicted protein [Xyrichtys novacula]